MLTVFSRRVLTLAVSATLMGAPFAIAQVAEEVPAVENSRNQFIGQVLADGTYVNSGPSDTDYAVMKLDAGQQVTVVGYKFDWLKIVPPEGAVCYVPKAFVEKRGDGSVGRTIANATVRIGSNITPVRNKVGTRLEPGVDVQILGEENENFKIAPPADVYLYVKAQTVEPVQKVAAGGPPQETAAPAETYAAAPPAAGLESATDPDGMEDVGLAMSMQEGIPPQAAETQTPEPSGDATATLPQSDEAVAVATEEATAEPAIPPHAERLASLEARLKEISAKPLQEQEIDPLLADYQALAAEQDLPSSLQPAVTYRVKALELRKQALADYQSAEALRADLQDQRQAMQAEQAELIDRVKETSLTNYAAIGTVRSSSLQAGSTPIYRLTDPATGRTLVYLRSDEANMAAHFGQLVGVNGVVTEDPILKVKIIASPTDITAVESASVNNGVTATLLPPSLQTRTAAAE